MCYKAISRTKSPIFGIPKKKNHMNIHEYQAKGILSGFGVTVQRGKVVDKLEDAVAAAKELNAETGTEWFVVKAQIHAG